MHRITQAAAAVGCHPSTLRRWDRDGLLPFPIRRDSLGYRAFSDDDIEQLRLFVEERRKQLEAAWAGNGN